MDNYYYLDYDNNKCACTFQKDYHYYDMSFIANNMKRTPPFEKKDDKITKISQSFTHPEWSNFFINGKYDFWIARAIAKHEQSKK